MMREILFRGKHKGQWVYGSLICCTNFEGQTFYQIDNGKMNDHQVWDVDPETVGQFALEKGEKEKLFEGDTFHLGDPNITYTVVWHDTGLKGRQNGSSSFVGLEAWRQHIVITGNIHDQ